ncbi:hypothetical protein BWQ96_09096 [Gracilariopsis chorda]|uniref:DDE-1 domain-containing protein n=1 Tax=Gracilariopsis chorda TaxID=448386 RepID=A0A2V3IJ77_9FLOR|nr:hypothetical protein BWQ96_09096 [Gracilariopsis chorda]|eukprot:PXF41180.1 hypothetical protein BWQ96_09096 [Gracilariopsis chorda]
MDIVEMLVKKFTPWRKESLLFRNDRPRRCFCKLFEVRHNDRIIFRKPSRQDTKRFEATNAKLLVAHMSKFKNIIEFHKILSSHIANVHVTGFSPSSERKYGNQKKVLAQKRVRRMLPNPGFENVNRITFLAAAFANDDLGPPMFVFHGTQLFIRRISRSGGNEKCSECISELLPHESLVTARKDIASVDRANFMKCAALLLKQTEEKKSTGKILLIYDGYRSHPDIPILEMLAKSNVIAYVLPANTSGTTQPLDIAIFQSLKYHYRALL